MKKDPFDESGGRDKVNNDRMIEIIMIKIIKMIKVVNMNKEYHNDIKPFISILIIIVTLFSLVFLKMEIRHQGYKIWKKTRIYKKIRDTHRMQVIKYARLKSPVRLSQKLQSQITPVDPELVQVIQISGDYVAVRQ